MGTGASTAVPPAAAGLSAETLAALGTLPEAARKELLQLAATAAGSPALTDASSLVDVGKQVSACDMVRQIHCGEKTCAAFAAELLDRIDAVNGPINACLEVMPREALLEKAAAVDAKVAAKETLRPLEGLLYVAKMNVDTAGRTTHGSSLVLKEHKPATNCARERHAISNRRPRPPTARPRPGS